MNKTDFTNFEVGTIFNDLQLLDAPHLTHRRLTVTYPSRLEAMALDPAKIADNENLVYEAGQIDFSVAIYKTITAEILGDTSDIVVSNRTPRKSLVKHAASIMQKALDTKEGLYIDVEDKIDLRHGGLGSSSSLLAGTAAAVNELYNRPVTPIDMVRFCAQNHGEEIDGDDNHLVPVQCIGGSAVCGHFEGGLVVLSGQATPIYTANLPADMKVIIGIPPDFTHPDSQELMDAEVENMAGFRNTGVTFGKEIAYRLVHEVLPGIAQLDFKPCKDLIFDYRWDMGSIQNCEFVYPGLARIAEELRWMKEDPDISIISLSSVGPGYFALTRRPDKVRNAFETAGLSTQETVVHNGKYEVEIHE